MNEQLNQIRQQIGEAIIELTSSYMVLEQLCRMENPQIEAALVQYFTGGDGIAGKTKA